MIKEFSLSNTYFNLFTTTTKKKILRKVFTMNF